MVVGGWEGAGVIVTDSSGESNNKLGRVRVQTCERKKKEAAGPVRRAGRKRGKDGQRVSWAVKEDGPVSKKEKRRGKRMG